MNGFFILSILLRYRLKTLSSFAKLDSLIHITYHHPISTSHIFNFLVVAPQHSVRMIFILFKIFEPLFSVFAIYVLAICDILANCFNYKIRSWSLIMSISLINRQSLYGCKDVIIILYDIKICNNIISTSLFLLLIQPI
jgi:hypothetical protein